jgi:hypothetical protein
VEVEVVEDQKAAMLAPAAGAELPAGKEQLAVQQAAQQAIKPLTAEPTGRLLVVISLLEVEVGVGIAEETMEDPLGKTV